MWFLRNLTVGFGSGVVGAFGLFGAGWVTAQIGLRGLFGLSAGNPLAFPGDYYRPMIWGGVWGLLLALPLFTRLWWFRGIVLGLLATAAIPLYFNTALQQNPALIRIVIYAAILNVIWGLVAAGWYRLVARGDSIGR
jgi:hypothetical protein